MKTAIKHYIMRYSLSEWLFVLACAVVAFCLGGLGRFLLYSVIGLLFGECLRFVLLRTVLKPQQRKVN